MFMAHTPTSVEWPAGLCCNLCAPNSCEVLSDEIEASSLVNGCLLGTLHITLNFKHE